MPVGFRHPLFPGTTVAFGRGSTSIPQKQSTLELPNPTPAGPVGPAGGDLKGEFPNPELGIGVTGWLIATDFEGVDPTGVKDSTIGLQLFIEECFKLKKAGYVEQGEYRIGAAGKPLDFTKIGVSKERIIGYEIYCAAGAVFIGSAELKKEPVVKLAAVAEGQFVESYVKLGKIRSGFKESDCLSLASGGFSDSWLGVNSVEGASEAERANMHGILLEPGAAVPRLIANNEIHIGIMTTCGFGLVTVGNLAASGVQISGNQFFIGECINNLNNGILIDGNGVGHNTEYNNFYVGVCEHNGKAGIVENNGNNNWIVGNTNSNGEAGFILTAEAVSKNSEKAPPFVRGRFRDKCVLNGQPCDLVNELVPIGETAVPEAKPVNETEYENKKERPVEITLFSGAAEKGVKWFKSGKQQGEFQTTLSSIITPVIRLMPGDKFKVTYAAGGQPSWGWVTSA